MKDDDLARCFSEIRQVEDAMSRTRDALEQLPNGGITSLTYAARQIGIALRHLAALTEPIMREID